VDTEASEEEEDEVKAASDDPNLPGCAHYKRKCQLVVSENCKFLIVLCDSFQNTSDFTLIFITCFYNSSSVRILNVTRYILAEFVTTRRSRVINWIDTGSRKWFASLARHVNQSQTVASSVQRPLGKCVSSQLIWFSVELLKRRNALTSLIKIPNDKRWLLAFFSFQFFCKICNLFMDVYKDTFHCDGCGLCRVGPKENFFHCEKCQMCMPIALGEGKHKVLDRWIQLFVSEHDI